MTVQKKTGGPVSFMAGGMVKVASFLDGGMKASFDARGNWEAGAMGAVHLGPWEGMLMVRMPFRPNNRQATSLCVTVILTPLF